MLIGPLSIINQLFWLTGEIPVDWIPRSLGSIGMSMKGRCCLDNLISFYDRLVGEGKALDFVYLNISKTFRILLEKLAAPGLDGHTHCWVKNWLDG